MEDGPEAIGVWVRQRTRWFKGWAQTWLVHMRNPAKLWRELGATSFLLTQILFAGMLVSALAHPLLLVTATVLAAALVAGAVHDGVKLFLLALDSANILLGYTSFVLLGKRSLLPRERPGGLLRTILLTPPYWMLMSFAAWRAVWQLCRNPHSWEKTPHKPYRGRTAGTTTRTLSP